MVEKRLLLVEHADGVRFLLGVDEAPTSGAGGIVPRQPVGLRALCQPGRSQQGCALPARGPVSPQPRRAPPG